MENEIDLSEIVDKVLEDVESSLGKLEKNFKINQLDDKLQQKQEMIEEKDKLPYPSIRYPTSDQNNEINNNSSVKSDTVPEPIISETKVERIDETIVEEVEASVEEDYEKIPVIQSIPLIPVEQRETVKQSILQYTEALTTEEEEKEVVIQDEPTLEEDIHFIDIKKEIKLLHIFGPPGSSKTTIGIQTAIEIVPRKTYYFITSHGTSVLKRVKQMITDSRWSDFKDIKQCFFPVQINNLDELEIQLEKLTKIHPEELGMIVIDHVTDYIRGQIHKEEKRVQLRNLMEKLYLIADDKACKVLIINGFSYKDSAPAEDIIESFCDMTIKTKVEDFKSKLTFHNDEIELLLDNSGITNLHLNVYY